MPQNDLPFREVVPVDVSYNKLRRMYMRHSLLSNNLPPTAYNVKVAILRNLRTKKLYAGFAPGSDYSDFKHDLDFERNSWSGWTTAANVYSRNTLYRGRILDGILLNNLNSEHNEIEYVNYGYNRWRRGFLSNRRLFHLAEGSEELRDFAMAIRGSMLFDPFVARSRWRNILDELNSSGSHHWLLISGILKPLEQSSDEAISLKSKYAASSYLRGFLGDASMFKKWSLDRPGKPADVICRNLSAKEGWDLGRQMSVLNLPCSLNGDSSPVPRHMTAYTNRIEANTICSPFIGVPRNVIPRVARNGNALTSSRPINKLLNDKDKKGYTFALDPLDYLTYDWKIEDGANNFPMYPIIGASPDEILQDS